MTGTTEGGKKAAITRGHESLSKAGAKGGKSQHKEATGRETLNKSGQKTDAHSHKNR